MLKAGKVWGETFPLLETKVFELHQISFNNGYQCSKHRHRTKYNAFLVLKGLLKIKTWKTDYDMVDETILSVGELAIVKPNEWHLFEAMSDGQALEIYWSEFETDDIERENVGGLTREQDNKCQTNHIVVREINEDFHSK